MGVQGSPEFFETWMQGEIQKLKSNPEALRTLSEGRRVIPVVVHVIHNGEPVGQGANIPFSQIESQIRILTEDFTRTNPDTANTPAEFRNVAANVNIEFVLAKQDPDGLPTDGINRVQGPRGSYGINDRMLIASLSSWPPEDYLNVWVLPLNSPLLGFASFPVSNLPGLNFAPTPREADGITVDFRFFGVGGSALNGLAGRTATHEVGHFLGLRHIWGDGNCDVDDFVEDTPNQDGFNSACRINNPRFTCGSRDMTENYMDYTVDACMNIFTLGQKERMDVVLMNSPRRVSLVNGRATQEPALNPNSLTPLNLIEPLDFICELTVTPAVEVVNNGNNPVTNAVIELRNNGALLQRQTVSLNLATGERTLLSFNPITLGEQNNNFELAIVQVNGQANGSTLATSLRSQPRLQGDITPSLCL
ncbi:M43 family zinc metalloprotease [Nitritalea halalkaliphila]|uniref:M43 family zinc metalloprotease n=1 Tax=Nitritalea halalkaliphila TaxID=590849 RepID=UPI0013894FF3|nr:M43 family zinc metalloprotease [Nitritalea halalkaliphila]